MFAFTMISMAVSDLIVIGQVGTTIGLGLLFDTLVVRSLMTPSLAALLGRWFWWRCGCARARCRHRGRHRGRLHRMRSQGSRIRVVTVEEHFDHPERSPGCATHEQGTRKIRCSGG